MFVVQRFLCKSRGNLKLQLSRNNHYLANDWKLWYCKSLYLPFDKMQY